MKFTDQGSPGADGARKGGENGGNGREPLRGKGIERVLNTPVSQDFPRFP